MFIESSNDNFSRGKHLIIHNIKLVLPNTQHKCFHEKSSWLSMLKLFPLLWAIGVDLVSYIPMDYTWYFWASTAFFIFNAKSAILENQSERFSCIFFQIREASQKVPVNDPYSDFTKLQFCLSISQVKFPTLRYEVWHLIISTIVSWWCHLLSNDTELFVLVYILMTRNNNEILILLAWQISFYSFYLF